MTSQVSLLRKASPMLLLLLFLHAHPGVALVKTVLLLHRFWFCYESTTIV